MSGPLASARPTYASEATFAEPSLDVQVGHRPDTPFRFVKKMNYPSTDSSASQRS